jgi:pyruvate dehydrogenase E2 component (dihydrolipoamide acetyltransferase)
MIKEVRLPEISENVETGDVIKVMVAVGDIIDIDQPLVELETDKAVLEVPSPFKGKVTEILVSEGETIKIDQVIIKIDTEDLAHSEPDAEPADTSSDEQPAAADPPPLAAESEHADEPSASAPEDVSTGSPVERVEPETTAKPAPKEPHRPAPASPSLRRLARELGVDINAVRGSGPGGRILEDDLKGYARSVVSGASAPAPGSLDAEATETTKWGPVVREPMSKVRQITARTMSEAWQTIPHVTQYDTADITEIEEIRKRYSKKMEGGKLTMTAILLKVAASALKVFPQFNASVDMKTQEIIYKRFYDIGVAVDTDRGLLVPVIRSVDNKNINELSHELNDVAERARNKKIKPDEMDGGTFTISNLGGIGGTNFSPIIYPPQVAILGVARGRLEPVYRDDQFEPRLMLPISVSYDHRVIDGADAARFLRWFARALEEPLLMALEG